jgi:hypothetical protein
VAELYATSKSSVKRRGPFQAGFTAGDKHLYRRTGDGCESHDSPVADICNKPREASPGTNAQVAKMLKAPPKAKYHADI